MPIRFGFTCDGIAYDAVAEETANGAELTVSGVVTTLPFTIESAEARRLLCELLGLRPDVPCAKVALADRNTIRLEGRLPLAGAATPPRLVAAATAIVVSARPLIDVVLLCRAVAGMPPLHADTETGPTAAEPRRVA